MTGSLRIIEKLPFLVELFLNGSFIFLYSLKKYDKIPKVWNVEIVDKFFSTAVWIVPLVILFVLVGNYLTTSKLENFFRRYIFSLIVFFPLLITWGDLEFTYWLGSAHLLSSILSLYDADQNTNTRIKKKNYAESIFNYLSLKPAQIVLVSFLAIIGGGTFLLMLPIAAKDGQVISFIDALFMATSATCVTGLTTLSLTENFSLLGQGVILFLIQIGGLSFMTLYSSMTVFLGKSLGVKDRILMQGLLDVNSQEELLDMIVDIIKYTLIIELWGGIILTVAFSLEGFEFGKALYYGFFHSISAFCNAGFSLFPDSLESFALNPIVNATVTTLVTLGGLGFIVLKELTIIATTKKKWNQVGLHTKIVVWTSAILTLAGTFIFFFGEFLNAIDDLSIWGKIQVSYFQSVTLRTAGFNTIPLNNLELHTIYFMTLFMFIGASPGSTGGGIKTSTFAVLIQSIRATLSGSSKVEFFDRTIPNLLVVRATALFIISLIVTTSFIFIMMVVEKDQSFLTVLFEVISASGTVGLSLGITPYLSGLGKLAISFLMFAGRIGPLTLVLAFGERIDEKGDLTYPEGRTMIG